MAEPFRMNTLNMDVTFHTNSDGNVMTTLAGFWKLNEGHDMVDGQAVASSSSSPSLSSLLVSYASCNWEMALFSYRDKRKGSRVIKGGGVALEDRGHRKGGTVGDNRKRKATKKEKGNVKERKEKERKETVGKELERKEIEGKRMKRKEMERKELERKEIERKGFERMEMEIKEMERKETKRKEMERKEMERKDLVTQLQEAKGEIARLEGVIRRMSTEREDIERRESERRKMEWKDSEKKETERKETERKELVRKESARIMDMAKDMLPSDLGETIMEEANRMFDICAELENLQGGSYGKIRICAGKILEANLRLGARSAMSANQLREIKKGGVRLEEQIMGLSSGLSSSSSSSSPPCKRGDMKVVTETDFARGITVDLLTRKENGTLPSSKREVFSSLPPLSPLPQRPSRNLNVRNDEDRLSSVVQAFPPVVIGDFEGGETGKEVCKDGSLQDGGGKTEWRPVVGRRRRRESPLPPLLDFGKTNRKETERKELERKDSERMEMERKEIERKETDRKEVVKDGQMCDGPGDGDATIIMDWANMMYRKRKIMGKEMERKEMERKEKERKVDEDMEVAYNRKERHSPIGQQRRNGPRPTLSSAVSIVGRTEGFSYAEALRNARQHIDLEALGIGMTHVKKIDNGCLIEVLGEDSYRKAEVLGTRLREVLKDSVRVSCPLGKKRELRITGFDESILAEEIVRVLSSCGGCSEADVRVGPIRTLHNGLGLARVQLPAAAAAKLVGVECVRLGWMMARVELLKTRPLQCYRCWRYGHTQSMCHSAADRRNACFKCGQSGHLVSTCQNRAHCAVCHDAGLEAMHRFGGLHCGAQVQK